MHSLRLSHVCACVCVDSLRERGGKRVERVHGSGAVRVCLDTRASARPDEMNEIAQEGERGRDERLLSRPKARASDYAVMDFGRRRRNLCENICKAREIRWRDMIWREGRGAISHETVCLMI